MPTIAFATCSEKPEIEPDDALVAQHLPVGVDLAAAPWDAAVDWAGFDLVVLRSTWDYHTRPVEFGRWLDVLDAAGTNVWNPTTRVRWNLDKTYLRDLAGRGVDVVPTRWCEAREPVELDGVLAATGWRRAIVKPTIGASSWGLHVVEPGEAAAGQSALDAALARGGVMIQPLLAEVGENGEWSLIFFDGVLSHAVVKRARAEDVRVQSDHGGSVTAIAPPPALAGWASECLMTAGGDDCLYARVDAVETAKGPLLMELELIEPQLFLGAAAGGAHRFARALLDRTRLP